MSYIYTTVTDLLLAINAIFPEESGKIKQRSVNSTISF